MESAHNTEIQESDFPESYSPNGMRIKSEPAEENTVEPMTLELNSCQDSYEYTPNEVDPVEDIQNEPESQEAVVPLNLICASRIMGNVGLLKIEIHDQLHPEYSGVVNIEEDVDENSHSFEAEKANDEVSSISDLLP
jgi:hypothetical protein